MTERKIVPLRYAYNKINGISEQVMTWHHDKHYAGYVNMWNKIQELLTKSNLADANANYSDFGELKRRETFNANGSILHEIFFDVMGGNGEIDEKSEIVKKLEKDFGSIDNFKNEFIASAKTALGWAVLCYDPSISRFYIYTGDSHNQGGVWGCIPLIPLDVFEHAYYKDYGPDRASYITAFLNNLDWKKVNEIAKKYKII